MNKSNIVAISGRPDYTNYPSLAPFLPSNEYPELIGMMGVSHDGNNIYELVRNLFYKLGFDKDNYDTPEWNPLSEIVKPGDHVLIKPNLVRHIHLTGGDYRTVVTHPSLIRCVLDYVGLALKGKGEITLGDAPVQSTDFETLVEKNSLDKVCTDVSKIWGVKVNLLDFRLWSIKLGKDHDVVDEQSLTGDTKGYCAVDLGVDSHLQPIASDNQKFRITSYDTGELQVHHNSNKNEYLIPQTVLDANVVINLPKLKTHRKVALTAALKNLVGINGHKDWLPHHRIGSISQGGDEYDSTFRLKQWSTNVIELIDRNRGSKFNTFRDIILRVLAKIIKYTAPDPYREGSWHGNDTLWRTVLDLNRLLIYADSNGIMQDTKQRKCLTIVDGIIAGEKEGPMEPDARKVGILVGGENPVVVDAVLATMIGFDYKKIPLIHNGFINCRWPLVDFKASDIQIHTIDKRWDNLAVGEECNELCFEPSSGWKKHVEFDSCIEQSSIDNKDEIQNPRSETNWI